jgi:signal transduction histidine kinase
MRIARDLHDTLLQSCQGVLLKFRAVTYMLPDRPAEARSLLDATLEQARHAMQQGRDAVQGLRSSTTAGTDLSLAIGALGESLAADVADQPPPEFRVHVEGTPTLLAPHISDEVYLIAGEALRNAFRHARATRIDVDIAYHDRLVRLCVRDNGKGIDPAVLADNEDTGHFGLATMRERGELVGGTLTVRSERDFGTEVELTIPG